MNLPSDDPNKQMIIEVDRIDNMAPDSFQRNILVVHSFIVCIWKSWTTWWSFTRGRKNNTNKAHSIYRKCVQPDSKRQLRWAGGSHWAVWRLWRFYWNAKLTSQNPYVRATGYHAGSSTSLLNWLNCHSKGEYHTYTLNFSTEKVPLSGNGGIKNISTKFERYKYNQIFMYIRINELKLRQSSLNVDLRCRHERISTIW